MFARWERFRQRRLERSLLHQQTTRCDWPAMNFRLEDDGLWAYADTTKYTRSHPRRPDELREVLLAGGLAPASVGKLLSGGFPLSSTNNPDLNRVLATCEEALRETGEWPGRVPVGLGLVHYFNAGAHRSFWGHTVLLHAGLVLGLDELNTWLLMYEATTQGGFYRIDLTNDPEIEVSLVQPPPDPRWEQKARDSLSFFAGHSRGINGAVPVTDQDIEDAHSWPETARMGYTFAFVQRCWVLLHEFGHVVMDHRPSTAAQERAEELEADRFATRVLLRAPKLGDSVPLDLPLRYLFGTWQLAQTAYPPPGDRHPLASERMKAVWETASRYADWGEPTLPDSVQALSATLTRS